MLLQIVATLACFLAVILQFAVHRSPDIHDTTLTGIGRRITMGALLVAGLYCGYHTLNYVAMQAPVVLIIGLFALGQLLFGLNNLEYLRELWHKSNLHSSL